MHRCEAHEIAISSLIDGELDHTQTLATLEHLVACGPCQTFFRAARALESRLDPMRRTPAPARVAPAPRRRGLSWAGWSAAAVAMLLLGLTLGPPSRGPDAPPRGDVLEIGDGGKMSDDRFVAVATELLQADARDQIEMLQVLQHVQSWRTEESPGRISALHTDVDPSSRWSQLPLTGEARPDRNVY